MSIKADTRYTMKNPGSCPGCFEDDRQYIETEEYSDDRIREIRRGCDVCGTRWDEVHSATPDKVEISRDPQERLLDEYLVPAKGTMAPTLSEIINFDSPAGKYLAAKIGRKAHSGAPSTEHSQLEAAWFGGAPAAKTAEWKGWDEDMPVQVVTSNGIEVFKNLAAAKKKYRDLDPRSGKGGFTWAMKGSVKGRPAIRFEESGSYKQISRAAKTASNGHIMLQGLVDFRKLGKVRSSLKGVDDQSAELLRDVLEELADAMELTSGQQQALNRLKWVAEKGGSADPSLLRNNIFKAANSLGMKLPSGMFASQRKQAKPVYTLGHFQTAAAEMDRAVGEAFNAAIKLKGMWDSFDGEIPTKQIPLYDMTMKVMNQLMKPRQTAGNVAHKLKGYR
jgi:hypothetical protein